MATTRVEKFYPQRDNSALMCGRYRLSRRKQILAEYFDVSPFDDDWEPRYNIAPTQPVPVIRQHPKEPRRVVSLMRWGLIPSWAKGTSVSASMINARSETAATKPAFRDPMKFRRCLVPADGSMSGDGLEVRSNHTVSKSTTVRYSHSRACGMAGKIRTDSGSSRVRS
jgi:putative SOS response-associated peptidase YedK